MVRRLSGERRVGHAGTLDPLATGVLPICLGQGTRIAEFLAEGKKTYRADIEFGISTDTYDAIGSITGQIDPSGVTREQLEAALASFRGLIQQTPPMYSAIKRHGQPLYRLARAGINVERPSRPINIHRLDLIHWQLPVATVEIECSKGTYIRSLANDLGATLGCGAHLKSLVRLRCGPFDIKDSISTPELQDAFHYGYWPTLVYPLDIALLHWMAVVVDDERGQEITNGHSLALDTNQVTDLSTGENRCRVYTRDGRLLAAMRFDPDKDLWHPYKVFTTVL